MMAGWTPSEQELLEYVEGELDAAGAERIRVAIAASPELAETVAGLERARHALRSAPALELPEARLHGMLDRLPAQEPASSPLARLVASPRRLLLVLTPVAAAAAVAIALTTTLGDGSDREQAAAGEATLAQTAAADAGAAAPQLDSGAAEAAPAPVARVAGTPKQVAKALRDLGFDARVANGAVEVAGADPTALRDALRGREAGNVRVIAVP